MHEQWVKELSAFVQMRKGEIMENIIKEILADDILQMMDDTSKLLSEENRKVLVSTTTSYLQDNALTGSVELDRKSVV